MSTHKQKDAVIAELRSRISLLEAELKDNIKDHIEFVDRDLEDGMGVFQDKSTGNYMLVNIAFDPSTNQGIVVSVQNCGKDISIFNYHCRKNLAENLLKKYNK